MSQTPNTFSQRVYTPRKQKDASENEEVDYLNNGPNYQALKKLQDFIRSGEYMLDVSNLEIQSLCFLLVYNQNKLKILNLSSNMIADINCLQQHLNLVNVDASNNLIEEVDVIQLPKLEVLNLENNLLERVPSLQGMDKLCILKLSSNQIQKLKHHKPLETEGLEELYLDNNQIELERNHWTYWFNAITQLKYLRIIDFRNNKFLQKSNWTKFNNERVTLQIPNQDKEQQDLDTEGEEEDSCLELDHLNPIIFSHSLVKRMISLEFVNGQAVEEIELEIEQCLNVVNQIEEVSDPLETIELKLKQKEPFVKDWVAKHAEPDEQSESSQKDEKVNQSQAKSSGKAQVKKKTKVKEDYPPELQVLIETLEQVDQFNGEDEEFDELWDNQVRKVLDQILQKKDNVNKRYKPNNKMKFLSNLSREQSEEVIENFFQVCFQLIDKHPKYQRNTLEVIAKCVFIEDGMDFGHRCFETLMEIMQFNLQLCNIVENIVEENIIEEMTERDMTYYPVLLFVDLKAFIEIEQENYCAMLKILYDNKKMKEWVEDITEIIQEVEDIEQENVKYVQNKEHYDAVLDLMAVSVQGSKNNNPCIQEFEDAELVDEVFNILKMSKPTDNRYKPCLQAISSLANEDQDLADGFVDKGLDQMMRKVIKQGIEEYEQRMDFITYDLEQLSAQAEDYTILGMQLATLGGLFNADNNEQVIDDSQDLLFTIINILRKQSNDPIILKYCCNIAKDLFETDYMITDQSKMAQFYHTCTELDDNEEPVDKKDNLFKELIPYIGGKKYPELLKMTRLYSQAQNETSNKIFSESGRTLKENETHKTQEEQSTLNIEAQEQVKELKTTISLQKLNDDLVYEVFTKIIELLAHFSLHGSLDTTPTFDECSRELYELKRNDALFRAMEINDDEVRLAVVSCLYVVPMEELKRSDIGKIVNLLKKATSVDEGKTELVLATLFQILSNFIFEAQNEESLELSLYFQNTYGMETIDIALKFLKENTSRFIQDDEETDKEKQALSQAIVNYIKVCTSSKYMFNSLVGRELDLKEILINEEQNASEFVKKNPVDIETSVMGQDIYGLMQCITGVESLHPFTDTSMRVIMSMADLLMNFYHCHKYNLMKAKQAPDPEIREQNQNWYEKVIAASDQIEKKIDQKQKLIITRRKSLESTFWIDIPNDFFSKMDENQAQRHSRQHNQFTKGNGIGLLLQFMISRFPINEEMLFFMTEPSLRDQVPKNSAENVPQQILELNENAIVKPRISLEDELQEKQLKLTNKLEHRYIGQNSLQQMYSHFEKTQQLKRNPVALKENSRIKRDEDANAWAYEGCRYSNFFNFRDKLQADMDSKESSNEVGMSKEFLNRKLIEQYNNVRDQKEEDEIPWDAMDYRGDGFQNQELRKLSIAGMLRCLYASVECAPSLELRMLAIQNISSFEVFKSITQLCDSTNWDQECNIISKYFRLARYVLKLKTEQDTESSSRLKMYEMLSIVIGITMKLIEERFEECMIRPNEQTQQGLKVATYELSYVLFILAQQTNNLVFCPVDLIRLNRENEIKRMMVEEEDLAQDQIIKIIQQTFSVGGLYSNKRLFPRSGALVGKCEYLKYAEKHPQLIDESKLMSKRTVQMKCVEFVILKLIQVQTVKQLVGTLFIDMQEDAEIFEESVELNKKIIDKHQRPETKEENSDSFEEQEEVFSDFEEKEEDLSDSCADEEDEDGGSDESSFQDDSECDVEQDRMFGQDIEQYVNLKSGLNIEKTKDIVAMLIATCQKTMQFEIQNYIMRGVVFENKSFRPSFLQELLNAADSARRTIALQAYLNENNMIVNRWGKDTSKLDLTHQYLTKIKKQSKSEYKSLIKEIQYQRQQKSQGEPAEFQQRVKSRIISVSEALTNLTVLDLLDVRHFKHREQEIKDNQVEPKDTDAVAKNKLNKLKQIQEQNKTWEKDRLNNLKIGVYDQRLVVLTNQGIQVMVELPKAQQCMNCNPCLFCPRGPTQEFCIRLTDIEQLVLFAMIPQKLVIIFRCPNIGQQGEDDGFLRQQLTLNIPIFTSQSRLTQNLIENWEQLRLQMTRHEEWNAPAKTGEAINEPLFETEAGKVYPFYREVDQLVFNDRMVEYYLLMLLEQVLDAEYDMWTQDEKDSFQQIELIQVELLQTDMVRSRFLDKLFKQKHSQPLLTEQESQSRFGSKFHKVDPAYYESNQKNKRLVYILQFQQYLVILKEKWQAWELIKDSQVCKAKVKHVRDSSHYSYAQKESQHVTGRLSTKSRIDGEMGSDEWKEDMEKECERIENDLYSVVLLINLSEQEQDSYFEASQLHVYHGIHPSVRVTLQQHSVDLMFPGDMERQIFVNQMFENHKQRVDPDLKDKIKKQSLANFEDEDSEGSIQDIALSIHPFAKNYD